MVSTLGPLLRGAPIVLFERLRLDDWRDYVRTYRPTAMGGQPALIQMLMEADVPPEELAGDGVDRRIVMCKYQHSVAIVAFQESGQQAELRRRGEGEGPLFAIGQIRLPPLGRSVGLEEELTPGSRLPHVDPATGEERPIDLALRFVPVTLLVGQVDEQRLDPIFGEELALELGDLATIDDRPDQVIEPFVSIIGAFRGRRQAEPKRSDRPERRGADGR